MKIDQCLNDLAERFGIFPDYLDFDGNQITTSPDTQKAMLRANGLALDTDSMIREAWREINVAGGKKLPVDELIVESGKSCLCRFGLQSDWWIVLEGQAGIGFEGKGGEQITLPALPSGIHDFCTVIAGDTKKTTLIVAPLRAPSIESKSDTSKLWGLNAALYGLRSSNNRGLGDYQDLARLAEISAWAGADFLGINPLHSLGYAAMETISPYSPSHRGFLNSEHIALDQIPGLHSMPVAKAILKQSQAQVAELRKTKLVDYQSHRRNHHGDLEALFVAFEESGEQAAHDGFNTYRREQGTLLENFALYEAISEEQGADWRQWSQDLQQQNSSAISAIKQRLSERIYFHCWSQWIADTQIGDAQKRAVTSGMRLGLYLDLAVGSRRGGAESWCERNAIAGNVSLGAPPDQLNPNGQNWDITAYAPQKLAAGKYQAFRSTLAEAMRHSGMLRIDHALGLYRSFWIPDDGSAGGYIKQPFQSLLAIIAMEAEATDTVIIGEDLGLVPDGFRSSMEARGSYGYSILQYEMYGDGKITQPSELRPQNLACFGTHDTPTLKGYWQGQDIDTWQAIGVIDGNEASKAREQRGDDLQTLMKFGQTGTQMNIGEKPDYAALYERVHNSLAASAAAMVSVQLDDVLGQVEAQNIPGTIDEHPNWRRRCSKTLEEIEKNAVLDEIGDCMMKNGRGSKRKMDEI